jgi:hypothetical protein
VAAFIVGFTPVAHAQLPLRQCVGGKAQFAISGDSLSTFRYSITGGTLLSAAKPDSVVVQWGMQRGAYRLGVQEISYGGCEGAWVYEDVELVGTSFYFQKAKRRICEGDTMHIPVDSKLYKNVRWSDPEVATRGIVQPGGYRIWVEDMNGCKSTDSLTVVTCEPAVAAKVAGQTTP